MCASKFANSSISLSKITACTKSVNSLESFLTNPFLLIGETSIAWLFWRDDNRFSELSDSEIYLVFENEQRTYWQINSNSG